MNVRVRPRSEADRVWLRSLLRERWASETQVAHGTRYEPADLPGYVAEDATTGERLGVLCYHVADDACQIVLLHALVEGRGVGAVLLEAVVGLGHPRVRVTTTNDNVRALRWYQRRGFRVVAIHEGAVDRARASLKPSIPLVGEGGVEIHDEVELELVPDVGRA